MRLFILVLLLFAIPLLVFLFLNGEEQVTVNLGTAVYADVGLSTVVLAAVSLGAVLVGIIAMVEGAAIRLANRRLRRELHKLETEVNFLRTETPRTTEPPAPAAQAKAVVLAPREPPPRETLPTAPVYSGDEFDAYREPD